ncbi:AT-rich interactive domain-containing protein 3C [Balamuthia mandrillaris]
MTTKKRKAASMLSEQQHQQQGSEEEEPQPPPERPQPHNHHTHSDQKEKEKEKEEARGTGRFAVSPLHSTLTVPEDEHAFKAHLNEFMEGRGTPLGRVPQLGHREVDLFVLYREVVKRGGLEAVVKNKCWKEIASVFRFPKTCTNAGYTLRIHYLRYLYAYEQRFFFGNLEECYVDDNAFLRPKRSSARMAQESSTLPTSSPASSSLYNNYSDIPTRRRSAMRRGTLASRNSSSTSLGGGSIMTGPSTMMMGSLNGAAGHSFVDAAPPSHLQGFSFLLLLSLLLLSFKLFISLCPLSLSLSLSVSSNNNELLKHHSDYNRTPLPKTSRRLQEEAHKYPNHHLHKLLVLSLEAKVPRQVRWSLDVLSVLSYEEQLNLNSPALLGLIDALLSHSSNYFKHFLFCSSSSSPENNHYSPSSSSSSSNSDSNNDNNNRLKTATKHENKAKQISEIFRNLSFMPENESILSKHALFMEQLLDVLSLFAHPLTTASPSSPSSFLDSSASSAAFASFSHSFFTPKLQSSSSSSICPFETFERKKFFCLNALETFANIAHFVSLNKPTVAERCLPTLTFFLDDPQEAVVWAVLETLSKLTADAEHDRYFDSIEDNFYDKLGLLLCKHDPIAKRERYNEDEDEEDDEQEDDDEEEDECNSILEVKSLVMEILHNLSKFGSSTTRIRLANHSLLFKRLLALLHISSEQPQQNKMEEDEESEEDDDDDEESDEEEEVEENGVRIVEHKSKKKRKKSEEMDENDKNDEKKDQLRFKIAKKAALTLSNLSREKKNQFLFRLHQSELMAIVYPDDEDGDEDGAASNNDHRGSSPTVKKIVFNFLLDLGYVYGSCNEK